MYGSRTVQPADFTVLAGFPQNERELFFMYPRGTYPLEPSVLEDVASRRRGATVITASGQVAAYGNLYDVVEGSHAWLGNVIVSPEYRGRGAAAYLVRTMMDKAKEECGVLSLHLICHNINTKGLLLYTKLGFVPYEISEMTDDLNNRIAKIHMQIRL